MIQNKPKSRQDQALDQLEGGLLLLLDAVNADDPKHEIVWRIQEELRLVRSRR